MGKLVHSFRKLKMEDRLTYHRLIRCVEYYVNNIEYGITPYFAARMHRLDHKMVEHACEAYYGDGNPVEVKFHTYEKNPFGRIKKNIVNCRLSKEQSREIYLRELLKEVYGDGIDVAIELEKAAPDLTLLNKNSYINEFKSELGIENHDTVRINNYYAKWKDKRNAEVYMAKTLSEQTL